MKKMISALMALVFVVGFSAVTFGAVNPSISVTIAPISTELERIVLELGESVELVATTEYSETGNARFVEDSWSGGGVTQTQIPDGPARTFISKALFDSSNYAIGDKIEITYKILVIGQGNTDLDEEVIAYLEIEEEHTIIIEVEAKAAPAIAAEILKFNGIAPRYGNARSGGNFIADVARFMGPRTDFDGISKSIVVNDVEQRNPEYWEAVLTFLNAHKAMKGELVMPEDLN